MITATYERNPFSTIHSFVIADSLPEVGETIDLECWGKVVVKSLYHNSASLENYIDFEYNGKELTCSFEVR